MRLWTVHPRYLDARGLVALWREALLARQVLRGLTRGYRHHPEVARFRAQPDPLRAIESYLWFVLDESRRRDYQFDRRKLRTRPALRRIHETPERVMAEWRHLLSKLRLRSPELYERLREVSAPQAHPLFRVHARQR